MVSLPLFLRGHSRVWWVFTPVGSRKCGCISWSNIGRKTMTATPVNLSPGGVSCSGVGRVASLLMGIATVGSIWPQYQNLSSWVCRGAGWKGALESVRGLWAFDTSTLCWVCAGMLGKPGLGLVVNIPSGCVAKINIQVFFVGRWAKVGLKSAQSLWKQSVVCW